MYFRVPLLLLLFLLPILSGNPRHPRSNMEWYGLPVCPRNNNRKQDDELYLPSAAAATRLRAPCAGLYYRQPH